MPHRDTARNPFVDQAQSSALYADEHRLAQRTTSLKAAKHTGRDALTVICELARTELARTGLADLTPPGGLRVLDLGCGRGSSTRRLADELTPTLLVAADRSVPLLTATRRRASTPALVTVAADFHQLPLPNGLFHLAVAAFCLYHSPTPGKALAEIARVLRPGGVAILATKAADSYASLDRLVAASGLDAEAANHPSLYASFASHNAAEVTANALTIRRIVHETHRFTFPTPAAAATYLATSPKYKLQGRPEARHAQLTAALARVVQAGEPIHTSSTVTYLAAVAAR